MSDKPVLKNIRPEGLPRVEGHGGIVLEIINDQIKSVNVEIYEGPRLFEKLAIGKTPEEDMSLTSRICAICTLSHRYAAVRALEKCKGYTNAMLDPQVLHTRELMHIAEMIESHALHVFFLSAPDLLGYTSVVKMYNDHKELVARALRLKQLGTDLMKACSARKIHGENPTIGGFYGYPDDEVLLELKTRAESMLETAVADVKLLASLEFPATVDRDMTFMSVLPEDGTFGWVADTIAILEPDGEISTYPASEYRSLTNERTVAHSFAKRCTYKQEPFMVGALARILIMKDRLTGTAKEILDETFNKNWYRNPVYNILAQAIELVFAMERMIKVIDELVPMKSLRLVPPPREAGPGIGVVEAPRGILYHHYVLDDAGKISFCNVITPTAQFLDDMEASLLDAAHRLADHVESDEKLRDDLELIARSYDPCISCATHMVRIERK